MKIQKFIVILLTVVVGLGMWAFIGLRHVAVSQNVVATSTSTEVFATSTQEETTEAYTIHVESPHENTPAALAARTYIGNQVNRFKGEALGAYEEYQATKSEWPWRTYEQWLVFMHGENVSYDSYLVTDYEYSGGANGIEIIKTFTHNKSTGAQVSLADIIPVDRQSSLLGAVKTDLKLQNGNVEVPDIFTDTIDALTFGDLQEFYINEGTLFVVFSEYDVAPGALGAVRVELPLDAYTMPR